MKAEQNESVSVCTTRPLCRNRNRATMITTCLPCKQLNNRRHLLVYLAGSCFSAVSNKESLIRDVTRVVWYLDDFCVHLINLKSPIRRDKKATRPSEPLVFSFISV